MYYRCFISFTEEKDPIRKRIIQVSEFGVDRFASRYLAW